MDLKLKRNRAIHINSMNQEVNSHCTWTYGERHLHVRVTPLGTLISRMRNKDGVEHFAPNVDTILTPLHLNEKLHKNHRREGEVFTGDRKKGRIKE